ncbi:type III effector protein [Streptomyces sp. BA2]|uniref:type III effector protein n=1 Tax=Streptomyces sp. BA2 TaxID=436595 RepID=UPI001329878D|nr:type III effector protein [Streptomyces sp. BA2]MWA09390.1 type III effector protein [Streptomyces sp. BA2]
MAATGPPNPPHAQGRNPASFPAAASALEAIRDAMRVAGREGADASPAGDTDPEQALASLLLLREVREQLAAWEAGLIETARHAGASWADLAQPLGVASRQAAERRYLRQRPGPTGSTGEQRVQATRQRRAADRTRTAWARTNAAALRRLAGQVTALSGLPPKARVPVGHLDAALADDDPAALIEPLNAARPYVERTRPDLAAQLDALVGNLDENGPV